MANSEGSQRSPSLASVMAVSIVTSAAVSVATVLALSWGKLDFSPAEVPPTTEEVPAVLGMTTENAGELLEGRNLRLVVTGAEPSADVEEGTIARQAPLAGSQLGSGEAVSVVVSSGNPEISVPAVIGRPVAEARGAIEGAGLTVSGVSETGTGEAGTVTATTPPAGTLVGPGDGIQLTAAAAGVAVPEVLNLSRRRAREAIEAAGLVQGRIRWRFNDRRDPFIVLEQTPAAGTQVAPGSEIELVLNEE